MSVHYPGAEFRASWKSPMSVQSIQLWKGLSVFAAVEFQRAFSLMLTAHEYASCIDSNIWDFAVSIKELHGCGLSENDLRLLIRLQCVEHAKESATINSADREFLPTTLFTFSNCSCFVLTPVGIRVAELHCRTAKSNQLRSPHEVCGFSISKEDSHTFVPVWNTDLRLLCFRGKVVKRFARPATNQALVLSAFEEENWPNRIYDPLTPHPSLDIKRRLCDTIKCLNHGHENSLVRFRGDGSGEGILWEPAT